MKLISTLSAFILYQILFNIGEAKAQSVQIYRSGSAFGGPYSSVVSAIGAAANGDSLKLSAHTFNEHDILVNKNLIIAGTYTATDSSIIDGKNIGRCLRILRDKEVVLRDIIITNGFAKVGGLPLNPDNWGGGVRLDTGSTLTLCGRMIIRKNVAYGIGGGISGCVSGGFLKDTTVLRLKDNTLIDGNTAASNGGVGLQGLVYIGDNVVVSRNQALGGVAGVAENVGGIGAETMIVLKNGSDGGIRVQGNKAVFMGGGIVIDNLFLFGNLNVIENRADSFGGGAGTIKNIYGFGELLISNNSAKYGGGASFGYFGADSAKIIITKNKAQYGGGLASRTYSIGKASKNLEIFDNTADSLGGGAYFSTAAVTGFAQANIHHNIAKKYNGIYVAGTVPTLELKNTRLFNPDISGKHNGPEVYIAGTSTSFVSDTCWFGESDTTGMLVTNNPAFVGMARTVAIDWKVNNGMPVGWSPNFPVSAKMKIAAGGTLRSGSFKTLEGKFSASSGSFTPATATITSGLLIESIYKATSTGSVTLMGIVDADTFKTTLAVTGIAEVGFEQVKIYPNPATDFINLDGVESGSSIVLYDVSGKVVTGFVSAQPDKTVIDISSLPAGNYILKIVTKEGAEGTAKVRKE